MHLYSFLISGSLGLALEGCGPLLFLVRAIIRASPSRNLADAQQ